MSRVHQTQAREPNRLLVRRRASASLIGRTLALWHLLSLDAPTVAATWTAFVAWTAGVHVAVVDPAAMFLAVWMLYAADRLLDANPLFTAPLLPELQTRHLFHHRHRAPFLRGIALASLPLVLLLHRTQPAVLHLYLLLTTLLVVWLLLIHARPAPSATAHRLPKELAVGLFFPGAVFIPTVARAPAHRPELMAGAALFAFLCTLNCLFLYAWEHPAAAGHAHASTRWTVRHLPTLTIACTLVAAALAAATLAAPDRRSHMDLFPHPVLLGHMDLSHVAAFPLACGLSTALLLLLHARRRSIPPLTLRALADLLLLTPVPIALAAHFLDAR